MLAPEVLKRVLAIRNAIKVGKLTRRKLLPGGLTRAIAIRRGLNTGRAGIRGVINELDMKMAGAQRKDLFAQRVAWKEAVTRPNTHP